MYKLWALSVPLQIIMIWNGMVDTMTYIIFPFSIICLCQWVREL